MSVSLAMLQIVACVATAATTTYLIVESRERRQFLSSKAEELYTLVETVDRDLTDFFASCYSLIPDERPRASHPNLDWVGLAQQSAKIRMLIGFYFPSLWPHVKRSDAAVATALDALQQSQNNLADENALLMLDNHVVEMRDALDGLKHAVVMAHRDGRAPILGMRRRADAPAPQGRVLRVSA